MRRTAWAFIAWSVVASGCGQSPAASPQDAGGGQDARPGEDAATEPDAGTDAGPAYSRASLSVCWRDPSCPRVMAIAHGGVWDLDSAPYDSSAALDNAYEAGVDGVKIDVRVTADDVPVIAHSSPIENFESSDCNGLVIEASTAQEVTACHRYPSATETFQRFDDVIEFLRGKMVAQLTVKRSEDYERVIAAVLELGAEEFTFFEVETGDLQAGIPDIADGDRVWYLVQVNDIATELDVLLDTIANPRAFMFEFEPTDDVADLVANRLHPAGVRSFTYDRTAFSIDEIRALHEGGFDVVSTQVGDRGVAARMLVNEARGVSPP